jgi:magnesium transporter
MGRPSTGKRKKNRQFSPVVPGSRLDPAQFVLTVFQYSTESCTEVTVQKIDDLLKLVRDGKKIWINMCGLPKVETQQICEHFGIDPLLIEDILSTGERAKMDEIGNFVYCLAPVIDFNGDEGSFRRGQVSIILGKDILISFQDDPVRDAFTGVYNRFRKPGTRLQHLAPDYLCYMLLDTVVDNYFLIMEKVGEKIEEMEDIVPDSPNSQVLYRINQLRREMLFVRRTITPVREVINGLIKNDSDLIDEGTEKYFKDVYDHIIQANELAENYQDMMLNMQDLYLNNMDLRMNEIMKVLTVVTTLVAPLTLIAGIYGMNFKNMPELETHYGYYICLGVMAIILVIMLSWFRRKRWF